MSDKHGAFVWYELMTTDTAAANEFYKDVVGWTSKDTSIPGAQYTSFFVGERPVAGLMSTEMTASESGETSPPAWIGYVGVDDVDAAAAKVTELGGTIYRQPDDIPSVGRFAVAGDPHGAAFCLFKGDGDMPPLPQNADGNVGWHELMAGALNAAFDFYSALFGWTKDQAIPMGDMGDYQLFAHNGGNAIGGMMTKPDMIPAPPYWGYYINVEALDAAVARSDARGGKVINGPMEVPGGAWIVNCVDPQGAHFSLVSMKR